MVHFINGATSGDLLFRAEVLPGINKVRDAFVARHSLRMRQRLAINYFNLHALNLTLLTLFLAFYRQGITAN